MFFFFNDTATTEIYTLSLHDALPIFIAQAILVVTFSLLCYIATRNWRSSVARATVLLLIGVVIVFSGDVLLEDRKSTRLNSSHANISYAVFCLKKKNQT